MKINRTYVGSPLRIAIGIILLAILSLAGGGNALTISSSGDTINGSIAYGPAVWNSTNFPALMGWETLSVHTSGTGNRSIDQSSLIYNTTGQPRQLKVVEAEYSNSTESELQAAGLENFGAGDMAYGAGNYTIIGWMAEKYVAIKAKDNKHAKLLIEQDLYDTKSLVAGETWNMGEGWELTLNSTDTRALPAQARLILSKYGIFKDDKVISSGTPDAVPIYTFVEPSLAGETNVPVLVTYADNITPDRVQLKYTWLISDNASIIMAGDVFGLMKVTSTYFPLELKNTETIITLLRNSMINLFDGFYLVVNDTPSLEYYPIWTLTPPHINQPPVADFIYSPLNPAVDQEITFDASPSFDPDGDILSYWWNINGTIFTTKIANISFHVAGTYYAGLEVTDANGLANYMFKGIDVTVPPTGPPAIISFSPLTSIVTNNVGESRTFSITVDQAVNVSWQINGTQVQKNNGVTAASYTNTSAALGMWNVSALAQNTNGSDMQTWIWNVAQPIIGNGSISGFKINDTNGNGKWNAGEKGISNWTIRLIGIIGKGKDSKVIRNETLTDATGFYKFDNLPAGRYFVIEKLKKGFVPTSSPVKRIKIAQGKNSMNNNFTNRPVHSLDRINGQRDIDDYEVINRDIARYKEDKKWN